MEPHVELVVYEVTYCLDPDAVIEINRRETGFAHLVLDRGKLESALARPLASFAGAVVFPTTVERAAALLEGVAQAHAFFDGNKRTAWIALNTYLDLCGLELEMMTDEESGAYVLAVVNKHLNLKESALWIVDRML